MIEASCNNSKLYLFTHNLGSVLVVYDQVVENVFDISVVASAVAAFNVKSCSCSASFSPAIISLHVRTIAPNPPPTHISESGATVIAAFINNTPVFWTKSCSEYNFIEVFTFEYVALDDPPIC